MSSSINGVRLLHIHSMPGCSFLFSPRNLIPRDRPVQANSSSQTTHHLNCVQAFCWTVTDKYINTKVHVHLWVTDSQRKADLMWPGKLITMNNSTSQSAFANKREWKRECASGSNALSSQDENESKKYCICCLPSLPCINTQEGLYPLKA